MQESHVSANRHRTLTNKVGLKNDISQASKNYMCTVSEDTMQGLWYYQILHFAKMRQFVNGVPDPLK